MDYKHEIEKVKKEVNENNHFAYNDIFDFTEMPNEELYQKFYEFCRENLNIQVERENLPNAYFLFTNGRSENAMAMRTEDNRSAIFINMGLMKFCIETFMFNIKLNDYIKKTKPELSSKFDCDVSYLTYQLVTQFSYYHELAHLFQFTELKEEKKLQERGCDSEFNIMKHKLEINADTLASIYMATHIDQYIQKIFKQNITSENIINTVTVFGASLLEYIISFNSKPELYLMENSHPHALIRMLNIVLNFVNHLSQLPIYKENGIELNGIELYRKILDLHNELIEEGVFKNKIPVIKESDIPHIMSYVEEIRDFGDNHKYADAMFIWDKHVTAT